MKINTLLESTVASDTSNSTNSAPKFGRSDKFLEEKDETVEECTTSGSVASVDSSVGGMQRRGKGSMLQGIKTSAKYPNSKQVKEAQLDEVDPRNFDSDEDYYAARNAPAKARSHSRPSPGVNQDDEAYFREIFRKKRLAAQQQERSADHDRLATGTNEGEEMSTFAALKDWRVWDVRVFNNFYAGKYADYGPRLYSVVASSPEEARQVILDNPDYVLQDLLSRKLQNGKKVLPRGSALPIEEKRVGKAQPGTITTMALKKMLTPDGVQSFKFTNGKIVDGAHVAGGEEINEKSKSQAQFRTMAAVAHNPKFAKKVGISPKVGKEFHKADKKQDYKDLPKEVDEGFSDMMAKERKKRLAAAEKKKQERLAKEKENKKNKEQGVAEMDGNGSGRDGSNRKRIGSYGSRDRDITGPDVHLGSDSMIASKDMQDRALDKLTKMLSEPENMKVLKRLKTKEGVAEGWDPDTTRLEQDVRDALENGDDYTAKQYAKMAPTPEAKKYLLNIIKQAMYLDDLGGETDWKGVAEGRKEDEEQYRQQSDQAWDKVYSQAKGPVSRFATKVAAKLDGSKRKLGQNKEQGVAEGTETGPYKVMGGEDGYYIVGPGRKLNSGACYYDSQDAHEACATLNKRYSQQGVAEGDNPEYDDEAGMAESNLHTIARAAQGLIDTIGENENLPEWCQEKIAKVEGMLVAVWDYLESQEEQGIDPQVDEDWQKTNKQDKTDGMSPKAVKAYRRENPGSKLKTAVTTKPSKLKPGSKAAKRRKSFCARMSGNKGPMKDEKGRPTPKAKALSRWNCESVEQTLQMLESVQHDLVEMKQRLDPKCWKGYKKQGTKMKGDTRVNNCVPIKEAEVSEDKLASDLYRDLQIFKKGADKDIGSKAKDKEISSKAKDKEIQKKK